MAKVKKLNESDMSRKCRQLLDIYRLRGNKYPHAIPVQCDGIYRYNNPLHSARQTMYFFAEIVISKRHIIKMVIKNKIFSKHGHILYESGANLPM